MNDLGDAATTGVDIDTSASAETRPVVEFARLPRSSTRVDWRRIGIIGGVIALLGTAALLPLSVRQALVGAHFAGFFAPCAVLYAIGLIVMVLIALAWRRANAHTAVPLHPTPLERALGERIDALPAIGPTPERVWDWTVLRSFMATCGATAPRTVVDVELRAAVAAIEISPHLIEPEAILSSAHGNRGGLLMTVLFVGFGCMQLVVGHVFYAGFSFLLGATTMLMTPAIRDRLRIALPWDGNLLAGQGWIRDRRHRTWRADDSMMLVGRVFNGSLWIVLTGPVGVRTIAFANEHDPDFVKLWQRWNHPDPRPELAPE